LLSRKFQTFDSYRFYETRMIGTYFADMLVTMLKNTGVIRREYKRALQAPVLSRPAKLLRRSGGLVSAQRGRQKMPIKMPMSPKPPYVTSPRG
jgi:hypothetical protein